MCVTSRLETVYREYREYNSKFTRIFNIIIFPIFMFSSYCLLNYIPLEFNFSSYRTGIPEQISNCELSIRSSALLFLLYFLYNMYLSPIFGFILSIFNFGLMILSNIYFCKYDIGYIYMVIIDSLIVIYLITCNKVCFRREKDYITKNETRMYRFFKNIIISPLNTMVDVFVELGFISGITIYRDIILMENYNNIKYTKNGDEIKNTDVQYSVL